MALKFIWPPTLRVGRWILNESFSVLKFSSFLFFSGKVRGGVRPKGQRNRPLRHREVPLPVDVSFRSVVGPPVDGGVSHGKVAVLDVNVRGSPGSFLRKLN